MTAKSSKVFAAFLAAVLATCISAQTDITWAGGDGEWTEPSNWSPAVVPSDATHRVLFDPTAGDITWTSDGVPVTLHSVVMAPDSSATVSIVGSTGHTLTISDPAGIALGNGTWFWNGVWPGTSTLTVAGGITASGPAASVGCSHPSTVVIDGPVSVPLANIGSHTTFNGALTVSDKLTHTSGDLRLNGDTACVDYQAADQTRLYLGAPVVFSGQVSLIRHTWYTTNAAANITTLADVSFTGNNINWLAEGSTGVFWNIHGTFTHAGGDLILQHGNSAILHPGAVYTVPDASAEREISTHSSSVFYCHSTMDILLQDHSLFVYGFQALPGCNITAAHSLAFVGRPALIEDGATVAAPTLQCSGLASVDIYAPLDQVPTLDVGLSCSIQVHAPLSNTTALSWSSGGSTLALHAPSVVPGIHVAAGGSLDLYAPLIVDGDSSVTGADFAVEFVQDGACLINNGNWEQTSFPSDLELIGQGDFNITDGAGLSLGGRNWLIQEGAKVHVDGSVSLIRDGASATTDSTVISYSADRTAGSGFFLYPGATLILDSSLVTADIRLDTNTLLQGTVQVLGGDLVVSSGRTTLDSNITVTFDDPSRTLVAAGSSRVDVHADSSQFCNVRAEDSAVLTFFTPVTDVCAHTAAVATNAELHYAHPTGNNTLASLSMSDGSLRIGTHVLITDFLSLSSYTSFVRLTSGANCSLTLGPDAVLSAAVDHSDLRFQGIQTAPSPVEIDTTLLSTFHVRGHIEHNFSRIYLQYGVQMIMHPDSSMNMTRIGGTTSAGRVVFAAAPADGSALINYGSIACLESSGGIYSSREGCHFDVPVINHATISQLNGTLAFEQLYNSSSTAALLSIVDTGIYFQDFFTHAYLDGVLDITNITVRGPDVHLLVASPHSIGMSVRSSSSSILLYQDTSIDELQIWNGRIFPQPNVVADVHNVTSIGTTGSNIDLGANSTINFRSLFYSYNPSADLSISGSGSVFVHDVFDHNFGSIRLNNGAQLVFLPGAVAQVPNPPSNGIVPSITSDEPADVGLEFRHGSSLLVNVTTDPFASGYRITLSSAFNGSLALAPQARVQWEHGHHFGSGARIELGPDALLDLDPRSSAITVDPDARLTVGQGEFHVSAGSVVLDTASIEGFNLGGFSAARFATLDFIANCPVELVLP